MTPLVSLKQQLLREIEALPEEQLQDVLQFVGFLLYCQNQYTSPEQSDVEPNNKKETSASTSDPMSEFIGAVSYSGLAKAIDIEIYET
ncbi:hypothetical protein [Coleofasciculus chthonoplastes]|uniref:hypothetical protein n=1 Tax=Coleofasciculus chthonoplastes TaxID=64178 RepID=UPI0032F66329